MMTLWLYLAGVLASLMIATDSLDELKREFNALDTNGKAMFVAMAAFWFIVIPACVAWGFFEDSQTKDKDE